MVSTLLRSKMNWSKKLYISILMIGFIYGALTSLLYVLEEPTTFEETFLREGVASFPSLTFCFRQYEMDNFTTFSDVKLRLKQLEDVHNIQCTLEAWGKGIQRGFFDLRNETILMQKFNSTLEKTWMYFAMIQSEYLKPLIPCFTINVPTLQHQLQESFKIRIYMYQTSTKGYYFTKDEKKQWRHNYELDMSSESLEILRPQEGKFEYLLETHTVSVKRSKYDCYLDNSMYFTDCIEEFYAQQLNCSLPWTSTYGRKCSTALELKKYRMISDSITSPKMTDQIKGCFKPNCKKTSWTKNSFDENWDSSEHNRTELVIDLPYSAKVMVKQEIKLAGVSTFIADCGSYLGLFLGASLLSLTDLIVSYIITFKRAFLQRKNNLV